MTRRDYQLLTDVFSVAMKQYLHKEIVEYVAEDLADALARDNKAFDKELFIKNVRGEK